MDSVAGNYCWDLIRLTCQGHHDQNAEMPCCLIPWNSAGTDWPPLPRLGFREDGYKSERTDSTDLSRFRDGSIQPSLLSVPQPWRIS
jgi:hypothetical protein